MISFFPADPPPTYKQREGHKAWHQVDSKRPRGGECRVRHRASIPTSSMGKHGPSLACSLLTWWGLQQGRGWM